MAMNKLKFFLQDYFYFNKGERRGIFVLLAILVGLLAVYFLMPKYFSHKSVDTNSFKLEIEKFEADIAADTNQAPINDHRSAEKINLFAFDPNTCTFEDLIQLGFTEKQALTLINYRKSGATFTSKSELKKIYGISKELYSKLEPFIEIKKSEKSESAVNNNSLPKTKTNTLIEINEADSLLLLNVKGIGPTYAKRIIKYRNKLGGFNSVTQLLEVYGIDSNRYSQIAPQLQVNSTLIKKISINNCTDKELGNHPYLNYKTAAIILNYRKQHGNFKSHEDLKNINALNSEQLNKILPYLSY